MTHTFYGKTCVELHFKLAREKYRLECVEPSGASKDVRTEVKNAVGATVIVRGTLDIVVGVVGVLDDELHPFLFSKSSKSKYNVHNLAEKHKVNTTFIKWSLICKNIF